MLSSLSIGRRMTAVLAVILTLSLFSAAASVLMLRTLQGELDDMLAHRLRVERASASWLLLINAAVQRSAAIAKSSDAGLVSYFAATSARSTQEASALQKSVGEALQTPEERALYEEIGGARKAYLAAREEISALKKAGDAEGAARAFGERFEAAAGTYVAKVQALLALQQTQLDSAAARVEALRARTVQALVGSSVFALLLGVFLARQLTLSIVRPVVEAEKAAEAIAAMDLSGRPRADYPRDEFGRLLRAIDTMREALRNTVQQVRGAADGIATASAQIATGNQDLSQRTEHTASNLQQTAAAMEELTGTVKSSADAATQANQLAVAAADVARRGGEVVGQVVTTMDEISASSRRIADIIGTIDGIAFQTNILALNAAVEAARAGEQGRGFAVVAGEVRSLAQRSAEAAREIKALIGASVDKVESGTRLVADAGQTMGDIVANARRVTDIIAEISAAAVEQSQGIHQVNGAVGELDQMTQQNAALVEEATAAAGSLRQQAGQLAELVSTFRLGQEARGISAPSC
ncbi:methyl-accepting chemotaxis protein [Rubrivivax gelatinosus]|uniref:Methyl-accepting chemotaxis protein n=1 Tax=Rubrivivax gelatinosus (strain NBRC 100245 / IL144) TaxID=983917 RepID=I0HM98_RUBGI|nr:methyl-accepting chemotaxis protein [Rubrivivax gelatinosus]BAL94135.1 methyl-accepting chemotaxis protein [Rubrivivax gelatinosus IL144]